MTPAEFGQIITGATGLLLLGFAGYGIANLRFKVPGTPYFVGLAVAAAVWSFGYAIEKSQTLAEGFMAAARVEYLGLSFVPWLWFLVAMHWMEHPWARSRALRFGLLAVAAFHCLLVWTNNYHHLWYTAVVPTGTPGFARFQSGPLYYPMYGVLVSSFILSSVLLLLHRKWVPLFRQKAAVILTANAFPFLFSMAYQFGFRPAGLDPTIFSLIPSFAVLAFGLFRHDFIRIVPVARELVVESMEHPVLVFDRQGRLVDHNPAAAPFRDQLDQSRFAGPAGEGELSLSSAEGTKWFRFRRSPLKPGTGAGEGWVILLTDVTAERRLLHELTHQATHDALTGLPNRRHFEDHALGEITRSGRHGGTMALVLFDLDWFKTINDRHGHPAGDQVLRGISGIIGPRLRPYDLLARIGGEEFAVLLPEVGAAEAREAAERWRRAFESTPQVLPGAVLTVTASFGVATLDGLPRTLADDPRSRLDALQALADRALYIAKAEGRNRVV